MVPPIHRLRQNGVTHATRADEMLIAADVVLNVLRPRRPITEQRPLRTPPAQPDPPLQGAHGAPPSREDKRNIDMVATYIGETRLSPCARGPTMNRTHLVDVRIQRVLSLVSTMRIRHDTCCLLVGPAALFVQ